MDRTGSARLWIMRALYVALCLAAVLFALVPLDTAPRGWAGPDLLLALTFAWAVRCPGFVPAPLVAAAFLLADLVFQRPPGLWAALALLASERFRTRAAALLPASFLLEWLEVAIVLAVMTILYRLTLGIMAVDQPPPSLSMSQMAATVAVYPLVVGLSALAFGVRKTVQPDMLAPGAR